MLCRIFLIISILFVTTLAHANGDTLTLDEAWQLMLGYDPALKASREIMNERKGDRMSALSVFLPQVEGKTSIRNYVNEEGFIWDSGTLGLGVLPFPATERTVPKVSANLTQLIFDSGKSIAAYKTTALGVEAAQHTIFAHRQSRAVDLVHAYCNYYLAKKRLEVTESAAHALNEHARVARLRYEQQLVPKTDMLAAEVSAAKAGLDVTKARDGVDVARKQLFAIIGETPENVTQPLVPAPPPEYVSSPSERPEIKAKTAQMNAARFEAKKEGLSYLPEIYFRTEAAYIEDSFRINKTQVTLWGGLKLPIFDGLLHWGRRNSAMAKAQRNRWQREAMQNAYSVEYEDARRAWKRSDKEISVAKINCRRASENLRDARLGYKESMVSALEVRDAVKLWVESAYGYHKAVCDKQIAAARLRQAVGIDVFEAGGYDYE